MRRYGWYTWSIKCFQIKKIRIGHDNSKPGAAWFLDEVRIDIPSQGEHYRFACHRWLSDSEGDRQTEVEIEPTSQEKRQKSKQL